MEFDGTAVQHSPKLSFSALGTAPQAISAGSALAKPRIARLRDNLYFFPARIAFSDSKHSDRQFFIGGNILSRAASPDIGRFAPTGMRISCRVESWAGEFLTGTVKTAASETSNALRIVRIGRGGASGRSLAFRYMVLRS